MCKCEHELVFDPRIISSHGSFAHGVDLVLRIWPYPERVAAPGVENFQVFGVQCVWESGTSPGPMRKKGAFAFNVESGAGMKTILLENRKMFPLLAGGLAPECAARSKITRCECGLVVGDEVGAIQIN